MKKKVWICNGLMNAGGAESLIMNMLRFRSEEIRYVMVIHTMSGMPEEGVWDAEIEKMGIPMYYLPAVGAVGIRKYCDAFCRLVEVIGKPDAMHCHLNAVGGIIAYAAYQVGIPVRIVHCHANICYQGSLMARIKGNLKLLVSKQYIKRYATDRWACSQSAADCLFGADSESVVIHNMIDTDAYLPSKQKRREVREKLKLSVEESTVVGAIGRIARVKNYELILQAIAEYKKTNPYVHFVCYGRVQDAGYFNELQRLVEHLGIQENVHFLGNSKNISWDIAGFDCFVMPSVTEGFGIAALEAQAAGLPTLVSTGVPRAVNAGLGNVQFLPMDDPTAWATAIEQVVGRIVCPEQIKAAFVQCGFDAEQGIKNMEQRYLESIRLTEEGNKS